MLVLSRKLGQRFQVGEDVRITIVKIDKNSVRIGIEAPEDMPVYREEIFACRPRDFKPRTDELAFGAEAA